MEHCSNFILSLEYLNYQYIGKESISLLNPSATQGSRDYVFPGLGGDGVHWLRQKGNGKGIYLDICNQ